MPTQALLGRMAEWKGRFGPGQARRLARLLESAGRGRFSDAASLIQLHEIALFLCAYPPDAAVRLGAERILGSYPDRMRDYASAGGDLTPFEEPDVSGIAGTRLAAVFGYEIARHLATRFKGAVTIDWDRYDDPGRLQDAVGGAVPLLEDDSLVEAEVPWQDWLEAVSGGARHQLTWLLDTIGHAPHYRNLGIPLRWELGDSEATRTLLRHRSDPIFYHRRPLIRRSEVNLEEIPLLPPVPLRKIPGREAARILDHARETSAARYRELHGFTHGDSATMREFHLGRGVRVYLWGVGPEHRLPLRAYHAATVWKNGVPVGYFEGLTFFERMEAGFNLYYTFRDGETAWLYRQLLLLFHQTLGVSTFSVDPYQIGHGNEEAIASGAFWFYRKLGFRPVDPAIRTLLAREENRIADQAGYRSGRATLTRLVAGPMVFELNPVEPGAWDRFSTRRLGLAAAGSQKSLLDLARVTGWNPSRWPARQRSLIGQWAPMLLLAPDFHSWQRADFRLLKAILEAKAEEPEQEYLALMRSHTQLRTAFLKLGSA